MLKLETAQGTVLPIEWIGISDFDGSLRFAVMNDDLATLFSLFNDPEHTRVLTRVFDEDRKSYEGYIHFKGIERMASGTIVVRLMKA